MYRDRLIAEQVSGAVGGLAGAAEGDFSNEKNNLVVVGGRAAFGGKGHDVSRCGAAMLWTVVAEPVRKRRGAVESEVIQCHVALGLFTLLFGPMGMREAVDCGLEGALGPRRSQEIACRAYVRAEIVGGVMLCDFAEVRTCFYERAGGATRGGALPCVLIREAGGAGKTGPTPCADKSSGGCFAAWRRDHYANTSSGGRCEACRRNAYANNSSARR